MRNPFKLPMLCEAGDGYIYSQDCRHSIRFDDTDTNCLEQKEFVASAINSHDKLTEQKKLLREALQFIADTPEVRADECSFVAMKALEATK
jgi:hypothetical protein